MESKSSSLSDVSDTPLLCAILGLVLILSMQHFGAAGIRRTHLGCSHFRRVKLDRIVWGWHAAAQTLFYPKEGAIQVLAV